MKVYFGTGRKSHRGGENRTLPPQKIPQRETSPNPSKWLRQQPRAAACAGNVCTGQGGAEKRHLEEEEGKRGWSSKTKSPSRLPCSCRSPTSEAAYNELIPTWAKRNTTFDLTLRAPDGRQGRPPGAAQHLPPPSAHGAASKRRASPARHQRQAGLAPSPRADTMPRPPSSLASSPLPLPGGGGLPMSLSLQFSEPRQPFR